LAAFLIGYIWGKKKGYASGYQCGLDYAPLQLIQETLEKGRCPICKMNYNQEERQLI
jgi:hypothetical protein